MTGVFEVLAADDNDIRVSARKALLLAESRIENKFGKWLDVPTQGEFDPRFSYVEEDFAKAVREACDEVGHPNADGMIATLHAHFRPQAAGDTGSNLENEDDDDDYDEYDDDHGPPDSPEGDSEADHVWTDLQRSESESPDDDDDDKKKSKVAHPNCPTCHGEGGWWGPDVEEPHEGPMWNYCPDCKGRGPSNDPYKYGYPGAPGEDEAIEQERQDADLLQRQYEQGHHGAVSNFTLKMAANITNVKEEQGAKASDRESAAPKAYNPSDQKDESGKQVPCPQCGGDGKTSNNQKCSRCKGSGEVNDWGPSTLDAVGSSVKEAWDTSPILEGAIWGVGMISALRAKKFRAEKEGNEQEIQRLERELRNAELHTNYPPEREGKTANPAVGWSGQCPECQWVNGEHDPECSLSPANKQRVEWGPEQVSAWPPEDPRTQAQRPHAKVADGTQQHLFRSCECENGVCHPDSRCPNPAGQVTSMYGLKLCDDCAANMPEQYKRPPHGTSEGRVAGDGNTDLGGPSPKMNKEKWTPQNVKKIKDDSKEHPTEEKDPIVPIKATNEDELKEIGEKTTEKVKLPSGEGLDGGGFAKGGEEKGPATKTWGKGKHEVDPVTNKGVDE